MKRTVSSQQKWPVCAALGTGVSIVIAALLLLLATVLINKNQLNIQQSGVIIFATQLIASFGGGVVTGKITGEKITISIGVCTAAYFLILIVIAMLFGDGIKGSIISNLVGVIIGAVVSIFANVKLQHKKKRKPARVFR